MEKGTIELSGSLAELGRDGHVEQYISVEEGRMKQHVAGREAEDRRVFRAYVDDCKQSAVSHQ
jgi:hypothetical protein